MKFPLSAAFASSRKLVHVCLFSFVWRFFYYISSLTVCLNVFNFHILVSFPVFLLLISYFVPLWSEKMLGMISTLLNWLKFILSSNVIYHGWCSVCASEECVFCCCWNDLYGFRSRWFIVFKFSVLLLNLCLVDLSITKSDVLKSCTTTVLFCFSL